MAGPSANMTGVLIRVKFGHRHTHTKARWAHEDGGRDWGYPAPS